MGQQTEYFAGITKNIAGFSLNGSLRYFYGISPLLAGKFALLRGFWKKDGIEGISIEMSKDKR